MVDEKVATYQSEKVRGEPLTDDDLAILDRVEAALADGIALKGWWQQTHATDSYKHRFKLMQEFNRSDTSFAFLDDAPLPRLTLPVMGTVDDALYDQPKGRNPEGVLNEFKEFVLHYFMRTSSYRLPAVYMDPAEYDESVSSRLVAWCPTPIVNRIGFGFSQHYYKLRHSGSTGKFPRGQQFAIVDLREIGEKYEWIVLNVDIFNFNLEFRLTGSGQASVTVPLNESSYLVVSRDFVTNETRPEPGVLGRYGFGYAFIRSPKMGLFAYGPGQFDAAIELVDFRVLESGETRAQMVFVVNRPNKVLNLTFDPVNWSLSLADLISLGTGSRLLAPIKRALDQLPLRISGLDPTGAFISAANLLTAGLSAEALCISLEQLEKDFLSQHFMQHYQMLTGSLLTWRRVKDWLDPKTIPADIVKGIE